MKSIVAYPFEFNNLLFPPKTPVKECGKLVAHYELYKKVKNLNGAIIKCGITAEEGFSRFTLLKEIVSSPYKQKMIAFQRDGCLYEKEINYQGELTAKSQPVNARHLAEKPVDLQEVGKKTHVEYIPGAISDSVPSYLIENPELKIAMLTIDLDDYEATLTVLEFFYPRLVQGGILIIDNYYKNMEEKTAVDEYFLPKVPKIKNYLVNKGPHYLISA